MNKRIFSILLATLSLAGPAAAEENPFIGVVNFASCITDSKSGKKEQENVETMRKQMTNLIEDTEKELREMAAKFDDTEFLDSLSPKAEEELKVKYQTLQEDMGRYQNQYYQLLQHAQYQLVQKISNHISRAAETVAKKKNLDYVINKEACFYIRSDLDVTNAVIVEMDKSFDLETAKNKLSDNSGEVAESAEVDSLKEAG